MPFYRHNRFYSNLCSSNAVLIQVQESVLVYQYPAEGRTMGFNSFNFGYVDRSSHSSNLLTFHSTARWKAHFDASRETDKPMVVDFTATWCGPCKFMDPIVQVFAGKYTDVDFIKIDVDELMGVSEEFQIQTMPTFLLIKKGKVAEKVVGARREELQKMIERHKM